MPQLDFSERRNDREQEYSLEHKKFLKIKVSQEIRQSKDRHYETPPSCDQQRPSMVYWE